MHMGKYWTVFNFHLKSHENDHRKFRRFNTAVGPKSGSKMFDYG